MQASAARARFGVNFQESLSAARAPLLFGLRLWASVCLALFIAFWLQFDNPAWAGGTAAIVCQPQLGASLRKGWFRMIGTAIGAVVIVVLTGLFPQDRIVYFAGLALWCAICAFGATVLSNSASYAAALAGYTAVIIAADTLGPTGGAGPQVFLLAVDRASEICIGIVSAGVVLAATDLGGAERQLAASFASLAAGIADRFTRMLALAGAHLPDTQAERREFVRRVIALDPVIDQALGESSRIRYHSPILQQAVGGLLSALNGWRGVAAHLGHLPGDLRQGAATILHEIPPELRSAGEPNGPARWLSDPGALRGACDQAARSLRAGPAATPSGRLLADETAAVLAGLSHALDGLALLVDAPRRLHAEGRGFRLSVPDWLPAFINAARALVTIGATVLFWVATAWPNGGAALVFAAVLLLLLSPRGDLAYSGALAASLGAFGAVLCVAIVKFAVLPALQTFPAFCLAIGLVFVPVGFVMAHSRRPAVVAMFSIMGVMVLPLLAPTNQMNYDIAAFLNSALAIVVGCSIAPLAFRLLPPLSPAVRARRLLALALRDLRRLATAPAPPDAEDWEGVLYGRLAALPDEAAPLQRAQLLAALSVGTEIIRLRAMVPRFEQAAELGAALEALARGNSAVAIAMLRGLDRRLGSGAAPPTAAVLRTRGRILVIAEALSQHASYFDGGARA